MKPSLTIDQRGVVLHVTTEAGEGVAVKLDPGTVLELAAGLERARATLKTPEGRSSFLRGLGRLVLDLADQKESKHGKKR